jgi:hypothetical protein
MQNYIEANDSLKHYSIIAELEMKAKVTKQSLFSLSNHITNSVDKLIDLQNKYIRELEKIKPVVSELHTQLLQVFKSSFYGLCSNAQTLFQVNYDLGSHDNMV